MAFDVTKAREILVYVPVVSATVAIPCLTVLAYRSWSRRWQRDLPRWRGTLGTISIAATFLGCVTFVGSFLMIALGFPVIPVAIDGMIWSKSIAGGFSHETARSRPLPSDSLLRVTFVEFMP
jgi:hypothetical protein